MHPTIDPSSLSVPSADRCSTNIRPPPYTRTYVRAGPLAHQVSSGQLAKLPGTSIVAAVIGPTHPRDGRRWRERCAVLSRCPAQQQGEAKGAWAR